MIGGKFSYMLYKVRRSLNQSDGMIVVEVQREADLLVARRLGPLRVQDPLFWARINDEVFLRFGAEGSWLG